MKRLDNDISNDVILRGRSQRASQVQQKQGLREGAISTD